MTVTLAMFISQTLCDVSLIDNLTTFPWHYTNPLSAHRMKGDRCHGSCLSWESNILNCIMELHTTCHLFLLIADKSVTEVSWVARPLHIDLHVDGFVAGMNGDAKTCLKDKPLIYRHESLQHVCGYHVGLYACMVKCLCVGTKMYW